jgi:hypothetical protein
MKALLRQRSFDDRYFASTIYVEAQVLLLFGA